MRLLLRETPVTPAVIARITFADAVNALMGSAISFMVVHAKLYVTHILFRRQTANVTVGTDNEATRL